MKIYHVFPKNLYVQALVSSLIPGFVSIFFFLIVVPGFGQPAFPEVVQPSTTPTGFAPITSPAPAAPAPAPAVASPAVSAPPPATKPAVAQATVPSTAPTGVAASTPIANQAIVTPTGTGTTRTSAPVNARSVTPQKIQKTHPRSVADPQHPFSGYFEVPAATQSTIRGKAIGVSELIENVRAGEIRRQLLYDYWELAGLLAEYNMRYDAELRAARWFQEAEQANDPARKSYMIGTFHYLQPQRQATEIAFIKKQHQLAERIRYATGVVLTGDTLPIPCDYPIVKKYETYSEKIARSEHSRSLGRLIPIQQQLIGFRRNGQIASENLLREAMKNPSRFQEQVGTLQQRVDAYVILTGAIVEYNKMIADYALETIGPGVDNYRLVGALIELPNYPASPSGQSPTGSQPSQIASPPARQLSTNTPVLTFGDESVPDAYTSLDSLPLSSLPQIDAGSEAYANLYSNIETPFGVPLGLPHSLHQPESGDSGIRQEMVSANPLADQGVPARPILYGARELPDSSQSVREAGFALPDRGGEVRTLGRSPSGPAAIQPVSYMENTDASPRYEDSRPPLDNPLSPPPSEAPPAN